MAKADYIIHTDGGSRGNPGPAALGFVIQDARGTMKKEHGQYIGETTNNDAEYQAVVAALKKLKALVGKDNVAHATVDLFADSELLVKQLNGQYKVTSAVVIPHFIAIHNLKVDFGDIRFHHVKREQNQAADRMVNAALDKESDKLL